MSRIAAIAWNTFRESIRDKILYNLLIFALLLIASTVFLQELAVGFPGRVMVDLGLGFINIFGVFITVFIGIGLVYKEIDRRTIYTIVSKPISRLRFLLGKYFGLQLTLLVNLALMTVLLFAAIYFTLKETPWHIIWAAGFMFIDFMVLTSVAMMFSTFTTPTLSALFTLSFWVTGHLVGDMRHFAEQAKSTRVIHTFAFLTSAFPDLERFNLKSWASYGGPLDHSVIIYTIMLGLIYSIFFFTIAALIFWRRDFK
jgi:ABC-type transport system involved in multi-copper enzyme maturation permease subunit